MEAPLGSAGPLGDGLGCDKLPAHMVLDLSHLTLVCLRLQAEMPSHSPSTPTMNLPQCSPTASFGPLGPRQEKPPSWTHSLLPVLHLLLSFLP